MNHDLQRMLEDACWDGDANLVAHLIAHPDVVPAAHHSTALLHAAHRGHWQCVALLIPVSNPKARNSEALWRSAKYRHGRVVRLLSQVSDAGGWEPWMWTDLSPTMARMVKRHSSTLPGTMRSIPSPQRKITRKVRASYDT